MVSFRTGFRSCCQTRTVGKENHLVEFQWGGVSSGYAANANTYAQKQRVYDTLKARYPELINRRHTLLEHDSAPRHTANVTKDEHDNLKFLPQSA